MKVLVVDDDKPTRTILERILNKGGIEEVDQAEDGFAALMSVGQNKYDVILMDINMPAIQGQNAVKALRAEDKDTPIIMVSSENQEMIDLAMSMGANDYVKKPITDDVLIEKVKQQGS